MQVKKWMLATGVIAMLASCGEAGTNTKNPESTTTTETKGTTRTVEVPVVTRTSFEAKYPQATDVTWVYHEPAEIVPVIPVEWEWTEWPVDTTDYVAKFKMNNEDYWVWYDEDGSWIATVAEVNDHASLPTAVNKTLKTEFPGFTVVSIDKENDKDRTAYEIKMEKGEDKMKALIAENGQVMKKKGKIDGEKIKEKSN